MIDSYGTRGTLLSVQGYTYGLCIIPYCQVAQTGHRHHHQTKACPCPAPGVTLYEIIFWLLSLRTSVHYLATPNANARSTCGVLVTPDPAWCTREKPTPEGTGCPYTQVVMDA